MTLKEKFTFNCRECDYEENAEISIKIADEFAIGFADWIRVCKLKGRPYDFDDVKQLLEIYKNEKDL